MYFIIHIINNNVIHFSGNIHAPEEVKVGIVWNMFVKCDHMLYLRQQVTHTCGCGYPVITTSKHDNGDTHTCQVIMWWSRLQGGERERKLASDMRCFLIYLQISPVHSVPCCPILTQNRNDGIQCIWSISTL